MGFTIEDALIQTQDLYQLKLLAGYQGCANAISWVHMVEDTTIIRQLWGKELAVTTGLGFQSHDALLEFIQTLNKYNSVGLIINTGKYINEIPQDIIDYCNDQDFPLLTTPWKVHMADLIKDFSMRCLSSQKEDNQTAKLFTKLFNTPHIIESVRYQLMSTFDVKSSFQVVLINIDNSEHFDEIEKRKTSFQLELCFEKIQSPYTFFWYNGSFVLIVNNLDADILHDVLSKMMRRAKKRMTGQTLHIGIGSPMDNFGEVILGYKRALAAVNMATKFNTPIIYFEDMGIYKIMFSIEDKQILEDIYLKTLEPLVTYDSKHHSELEKTLYYYLVFDGSLQAMAKSLYMHRNTINYRMNKIKELLDCDFKEFEVKMNYMFAYYCRDIVKG